MPNVIRVNAFGANGTFQTGNHGERYAFMDIVLLSNVRRACRAAEHHSVACAGLEAALLERRKLYPMKTWEDGDRGRHTSLMPGVMPGVVAVEGSAAEDTRQQGLQGLQGQQGEWFRSLVGGL